MAETRRLIVGTEGALQFLVDVIPSILDRIEIVERMIMALSDQEQQAVQGLSSAISQLGSDVDAAMTAATTVNNQLQEQVTNLEQVRDALQQQETADEATIQQLNDTIAAMQATQQQQSDEVVSALSGLTDQVSSTDQHVKSLGG